MTARLACDIGGTFTDLAYFDEASGALVVEKSLTTPRDLTRGIEDAIGLAALETAGIGYFVHGGTTVINAITERKGAKTALITTEGFRDVLEIARGNRPDLYNLRFAKPTPFVPRYLRFEVRELVGERRDGRAAGARRPRPDHRPLPGGRRRGYCDPVPAQLCRARA